MKLSIPALDGAFAAGGDLDSIAGRLDIAEPAALEHRRGVRELRAEMR